MKTYKDTQSAKKGVDRTPLRNHPYKIVRRFSVTGPVFIPEIEIRSDEDKRLVIEFGFLGRVIEEQSA